MAQANRLVSLSSASRRCSVGNCHRSWASQDPLRGRRHYIPRCGGLPRAVRCSVRGRLGIIGAMSQGSAVTGRRILRALWEQDWAAAGESLPLAAAFPLRRSPGLIAGRAALSELIPEMVATG